MNRLIISGVVAMLLLPGAGALAEQAHHPDGANAPAQANQANADMMAQMQERMRKMHQQMEQIRTTKDEAVRNKLIDEHMTAMQEEMKMMRGMGGGMMQDMMGGGMAVDGKSMAGMSGEGDAMARLNMMEKRMDMMQMMMDQLVQSRSEVRRHDHRKSMK
jgi:phage shock protein A